MIYLITFTLVLTLTYFRLHTKGKIIQLIYDISIVGLLTCIAGFRNLEVGTDTSAYPLEAFDFALNCSSIYELFLFPLEPLYGLLAFLISRFTDDISYFLFITHLIICGLFYITALRSRNKKQTFIFMFMFLFLCYVFTTDYYSIFYR